MHCKLKFLIIKFEIVIKNNNDNFIKLIFQSVKQICWLFTLYSFYLFYLYTIKLYLW